MNSVCPTCGTSLSKTPQRKTKCKACGEFIFVNRFPGEASKRLMNHVQAAEADHAWRVKSELAALGDLAKGYGLSAEDLRTRYRRDGGDVATAVAGTAATKAHEGDRGAILAMLKYAGSREERRSWQLKLIEGELAKARRQGFATVQIRAPENSDCAICKSMRLRILPSDSQPAMCVPESCPALSTRSCAIHVNPVRKGADGRLAYDLLAAATSAPVRPSAAVGNLLGRAFGALSRLLAGKRRG